MSAAIFSAAFKHVEVALQVCIHISVRISKRMADASLSGEMQLASGTSTVDFDVASAEQINATYFVYPGLAGTNPQTDSFDWGLPFFFGRRVLNAIDGYTTSAGSGPYVAY